MVAGILAIIGGFFTVLKFVIGQFSPESRLRRWELWYERKKTADAVEANRLDAANNRIDKEPDKTGQDLLNDLNEKFDGDMKAARRPRPSWPAWMWWAVLALVLMGLALGCARFRPEPLYIQFPDPPKLTWYFCEREGEQVLCLSQPDGAKLSKWFDKVRAFNHARERLQ
jgi:hypothetical protein